MKNLEFNKYLVDQHRARTKEKMSEYKKDKNKNSNSPFDNNKKIGIFLGNTNKKAVTKSSLFMQLGNDILLKNIQEFKSKYPNNDLNSSEKAIFNGDKIVDRITNSIMNQQDQSLNKKDKENKQNTINRNSFNNLNLFKEPNQLENENILDISPGVYFQDNINNKSNSLSPQKRNLNRNFIMEKKEDDENIQLIQNEEVVSKIYNISETWIDLIYSVDSKQGLITFNKKYLSVLKENLIENPLSLDLFDHANLNRIFQKSIKITLIFNIILKFSLCEFQYDNNLKLTLKKLLSAISDVFISIIDVFILSKKNCSKGEYSETTKEKIKKVSKNLKINTKNQNEFINILIRLSEGSLNSIKTFSNNYFKLGFLKPIHNIIFDIMKNIDKFSIIKILSLTLENILFNYLNQSNPTPGNQVTKVVFMNPSQFNNNFSNPSVPFISTTSEFQYSLVLDLDETLVHFVFSPSGGLFLIRPYAHEFLRELSQFYEIIIFTAAMKDYADSILDKLDSDKKYIKHRLYRNHTTNTPNGFVKDISKIGRDLSKMIIIDNLPENFRLQPLNGFPIRTWNEDMKDAQLIDLSKILRDIYLLKIPDVRLIIRKIKEEMNRNSKNSLNPYSNIDISRFI